MAFALDMQKGIPHEDSNVIEFPVIDIASAIGWDSGVVKSHLKNLEWTKGGERSVKLYFHGASPVSSEIYFIYTLTCFTADGKMRRSALSVHYDKLGLRVKAPGDLTDAELDEALDALIARTQSQELSCLQQLEIISTALNRISVLSIKHCSILDDDIARRSEDLKNIIRKYFQSDSPLNGVDISFQVYSLIEIIYLRLFA